MVNIVSLVHHIDPWVLHHSLTGCLPASNHQQTTRWQLAVGRLGVPDPANVDHSQESIGSGIITGPGDNHRFCSEIVIHYNECH